MATNIGPKIGVEGEAEYRKSINQIIQQAKTLDAQMRATVSSFNSTTSAEEKAAAKSRILSEQITTQKEHIRTLTDMMQKSAAKYGENDARTLKWREAVLNATTALNGMEQELADINNGLDETGDNLEDAGTQAASFVVTGVAGDTCTITNGTKTYTKTFGTDKKATFKGLATGTWTVKMTNGSKTSTRTITITADYALTIAYFSATIKVTYPAKSTCVIKNSSGTQVGSDTNTGTAAKTWTATVDASGTYTVTATTTDGSGKSKSTTVSITTDGQAATAALTYELILFNDTDNTDVTGGWTFGNNPGSAVTFSDATISNKQIVYSESYYGGIFTKKQIDVTDYNTLYCECTITGYLEYANSFGVSKSTNQAIMDSGMDMNSKFVAKKALAAGTYTGSNALSVDVSKITGNCSLGFGVFCSNTLTIKIDKVWLV